ncbi:MAG: hypothetical protein H0T14_05855 [Nocardioidaceae bacterium]|nr:hypothetical protein [Nocardioidaceae bacterium]
MSTDRGGATSAGSSNADEPHRVSSTNETTDYKTTDYESRERSLPVREEYVEPRHTAVREQTVVHQQARPVPTDDSTSVNVAVGADRQDGVRWGPIWAGLLTALTTFLLLELLFYSLGWLTLDPGETDSGDSRGLVTGILALVAFFIGGLIAGMTAIWKGLFSGLLHGFMVWALGVVAFIALTFFGGSALLGSFGDLTNQLGVGPQEVQSTTSVTDTEAEEISSTAKDAATPAFWGLFLPLAAAMLGGLIGSKIWPRRDDSDPETVRLRT